MAAVSEPTVVAHLEDPALFDKLEVRFERVSFRYPQSDQEVLSGLDLVMPTGRSSA